jgi:hypothetical protein
MRTKGSCTQTGWQGTLIITCDDDGACAHPQHKRPNAGARMLNPKLVSPESPSDSPQWHSGMAPDSRPAHTSATYSQSGTSNIQTLRGTGKTTAQACRAGHASIMHGCRRVRLHRPHPALVPRQQQSMLQHMAGSSWQPRPRALPRARCRALLSRTVHLTAVSAPRKHPPSTPTPPASQLLQAFAWNDPSTLAMLQRQAAAPPRAGLPLQWTSNRHVAAQHECHYTSCVQALGEHTAQGKLGCRGSVQPLRPPFLPSQV